MVTKVKASTIDLPTLSAAGIGSGGGTTVYATVAELPLSNNTAGDQAYVSETNRLYLWTGTGWYNIALINTSPSITGGNQSSYFLETNGTPLEITLVGSDPEGIPLTWSYEVTSGSLTNGGGVTATVSNVDNVFTITPSTTEDYAGSFSLTFKASDGVNIATAVSSFTLVFNVVNSRYTTLLAKGASATQNATFADSSTNNHAITTNGTVYQGTFSPYRSGGHSLYFDGSGDYLTGTLSGNELGFGTGDFTVELWYRPSAAVTSEYLIDTRTAGLSSGVWIFTFNVTGSNLGTLYWSNGSVSLAQGSGSFPVDVWTHVVYVRSGTTGSMYINGQRVATQTDSKNYTTPLGFSIGNRYSNTGADQYVKGYISNCRVVNGTAVYDPTSTSITVPTDPLTAITNTSLLINTPYIADSSTNAHAITVNGNTSTQPFSPFDYKRYDSSLYGSSAYFELTSTLQFPGTGVADWGTGDFTVETWIYAPSGTTSPIKIIECRPVDTNGPYANFAYQPDTGIFSAYVETARRIETSTSYPGGNWYHVAYVQYNSVLTIYVNGKADGSWANTTTWSTRTDPGINIKAFNGEPNYGTVYLSDYRIVKGTAVYTTDFTPPTEQLTAITDTSLLLNFTNAGIQDHSQVSNLRLYGNTIGSNTQTKNASYSMYFDGTGDYIRADAALETFKSTTDPFTIEAWIRPTASWTTGIRWLGINTKSAGSNIILIGMETIFGNWSASFNTPMTINTWNHFAFTYDGSVGTIYINGIQDISATFAISVNFSDCVLGIGAEFDAADGGGAGDYFTGYIEDLRISKFVRYTATFTLPTTELLG